MPGLSEISEWNGLIVITWMIMHFTCLTIDFLANNFQEHDFLRDLKFAPFSPLLRSSGKRARISNPVKNRVIETCSNIFFTLEKTLKIAVIDPCMMSIFPSCLNNIHILILMAHLGIVLPF